MATNNIDSLRLGRILQIAFNKGIRIQVSQDFRDFDKIKQVKIMDTLAREIRFMFQTGLSPAAVQYRNPGASNRPFPQAQQPPIQENTALLTEANVTLELEQNLWYRAMKSPEKYAEPLATVVDSAMISSKRRMAADLYGDGTGIVFEASAVADTTGANGFAVVTVDQSAGSLGFLGFAEFNDLLLPFTKDAVATNPTVVGTFYAWKVIAKDRKGGTITLAPVDSSETRLNLTASNIVDGLVFYRVGQPSIPDVNPYPGSAEFNSLSGVWPGLESLSANDGRLVHGVTMSGVNAGTRLDASSALLDVDLIHELMDNVKINVGRIYKWDRLSMAPEAQKALISSREADRRFISVQDNTRGVVTFKYQHENDSLETYTSEYIRKDRVWILPVARGNEKVLEFHGTDYEAIKNGNLDEWHLKPASGGSYVNSMQSFMQAYQVMIAKHPAAIGCLTGFTL